MLLATLCTLCLPFLSFGQQNKLAVVRPQQITIKRGGDVIQTLKVIVLPGLHVNSDKPKDEYLIPLKLTWNDSPLQVKSISYPLSEEIKVGTETLSVFTGAIDIQTDFKAPQKAVAGTAIITGKLRYQACNNEMCFRPASVDIRLPVFIE